MSLRGGGREPAFQVAGAQFDLEADTSCGELNPENDMVVTDLYHNTPAILEALGNKQRSYTRFVVCESFLTSLL
jgi:hypothetical protein